MKVSLDHALNEYCYITTAAQNVHPFLTQRRRPHHFNLNDARVHAIAVVEQTLLSVFKMIFNF